MTMQQFAKVFHDWNTENWRGFFSPRFCREDLGHAIESVCDKTKPHFRRFSWRNCPFSLSPTARQPFFVGLILCPQRSLENGENDVVVQRFQEKNSLSLFCSLSFDQLVALLIYVFGLNK